MAVADYEKALEPNPRLATAWVDLADALEQTGQYSRAETALEHAFEIQPYSPLIRWQAGNFFLRRGNLQKMYDCFKTACRYDESKLGIAIETAWKTDSEHEKILYRLIPDDFRSNLRYLHFLAGKNELDLALAAWQRCMINPLPHGSSFKPSALFNFIDRMLSANRIQDALKIWDDALRKGLTGLSDPRCREYASPLEKPATASPIWNGSFENEILQGGFDWRFPTRHDIRFRTDTAIRLKDLKSLRVTFEGENISSGYLYQIVPIPSPGRYTLDFFIKTDGLTTGNLPYILITGYPDSKNVSARSSSFPSTTDWIRVSVPFSTDSKCGAVRLSLRRDISGKLDNRIKGTLWLDGFSIRR